jgi:hypothetical protein
MSETAQATMGVVQLGVNSYQYTISLFNTSSLASGATIGTFWFAWDDSPDVNFLISKPTVVSSPPGWTASITHHTVGTDGYGIEWQATSSNFYLPPGHTFTNFSFTTTDPPSAILRLNTIEPAAGFQITASFVYAGAPEGDPGFEFTVSCFRAGTHILTRDGKRAVEHLGDGHLVATNDGRLIPVRSIGHRRIDCRRHPKPYDVWPVRVRPAAFGSRLPNLDLWLSPDHAVYIGEAMVPVRYLINGSTIVQEPVDEVTYYHVELATHDVILAEGLPCESYLDTGNRAAFGEGGAAAVVAARFS